MPAKKPIYRVTFLNQGQVYEVYARQVTQGEFFGFIDISGLVFGEKTKVVVDPGEERLRREFEGVGRFFVPLNAVIRIDEVDRQGSCRVLDAADKNPSPTPFPLPGIPGAPRKP